MTKQDFFGLKYFIGLGILVIGFFLYSASIGWKWFNPTTTETNDPKKSTTGSGRGL